MEKERNISRKLETDKLNHTRISRKLEMDNLNNTRDLGGMQTKDRNVIRSGKLIRSGQLFFASERDLQKLEAIPVRRIFDFRSGKETEEKPDPALKDTIYTHLPVVRDMTAGITREEGADQQAFEMVVRHVAADPQAAVEYMKSTYRIFVQDSFALSQYTYFLREVSRQKEGAVIWHCTAGKDRAGFASVLIQELLGVHRDDIRADYLSTEEHLQTEIEQLIQMVVTSMQLPGAEDSIRELFGVREEYLQAVYQYMEETSGSVEEFLHQALGVDDEMKERMRREFLL